MPNRIRRVLYDNNGVVLATGGKVLKYLIEEYCPLYPNAPSIRRVPGETRSHWLFRLTNGLGRGYMLRQWREQRGVRGDLSRYWRELRRSRRNAGVEAQLDPATTTLGGLEDLQRALLAVPTEPRRWQWTTGIGNPPTTVDEAMWFAIEPPIQVTPPRPRARRPRE